MKKIFFVIGLGRFGLGITKTLCDLKSDLLAIDVNEAAVNKASEFVANCAICDSTKLSALKELGVSNTAHAIIAIGGNFQATILTLINLKELGFNNITVRIDDSNYTSVMERLGAKEVVIPEEASAISLAHQIMSDTILDYYKINNDYGVVQIVVKSTFVEKSLIDLNIRNKFDVNIVGVIRNDDFSIPKGTDLIKGNDIILVCGKTNKISRLDKFINNN